MKVSLEVIPTINIKNSMFGYVACYLDKTGKPLVLNRHNVKRRIKTLQMNNQNIDTELHVLTLLNNKINKVKK